MQEYRRPSLAPDWAASSYSIQYGGRFCAPIPQAQAYAPAPSAAELAGVRAKLIDYLRSEAIRLLVEQAEARERAGSSSGSVSGSESAHSGHGQVHAPVPVRISPPQAEVDQKSLPTSAPFILGRALLCPVDPLLHAPLDRRLSAPDIFARRGSTDSNSSTSSRPPAEVPLSTLLARARSNIAADLRAHSTAPAGEDDKSWMVAEVGGAFVSLDEGFRRWTEEVTARALGTK